jgi:hypothetical protein
MPYDPSEGGFEHILKTSESLVSALEQLIALHSNDGSATDTVASLERAKVLADGAVTLTRQHIDGTQR